MTKADLTAQLENAKNNYLLGMAATSLFASEEALDLLDARTAKFGPYTVPFDQVARMLRNPKDRDVAVKEFLLAQMRLLVKESFELIKGYCKQSGQAELLKREPWYHFARLIRNCLSHDFRIEFSHSDKKLLPQTWGGRTLDESFEGATLSLDFFGYVQAWEMFTEFEAFVAERLQ